MLILTRFHTFNTFYIRTYDQTTFSAYLSPSLGYRQRDLNPQTQDYESIVLPLRYRNIEVQ
jgi:hypothetical protein